MHREVTVFGSANADLRVLVDAPPVRGEVKVAHDLEMGPGGKGLNQAVAAARMGARTTFVGAVGTDDHGAMLLRCLAEAGVEACVDEVEGRATGAALIAVDDDGDITVIELPGANATLDVLSDRADHVVTHTAVLLLQLESPVTGSAQAAALAGDEGATVVLNAGPRGATAAGMLHLVDVLVADEEEAAALAGMDDASPEELAAALAAKVPAVIVFGGLRGSVLADGAGVRSLPRYVAHALDASAVTDTFCGALAAGLSQGAGVEAAAARAVAAAALAIQRPGSADSIPTHDDVDEFLALQQAG
ncbi:PfkB family carbohydrate kinase [Demequina rhizosphaerae]|uniref:PfkB family carbohydrate kinase n=1 Tax=Demequina rhizosphaerae TaxID=1638985 RepID=UPI0009E44924|nr:PfkB family carbohydrate kinase [Demequina rhizosphaerae]